MLPVDVYMRTVGVKRNVDRAIDKMSAKYRAPLEAYAAGVNAFLKAHKSLPLEFILTGYEPEHWTIYDCGYVFGALTMDAVHFLPQSRPRLFIVAVRKDLDAVSDLARDRPSPNYFFQVYSKSQTGS